MSRKLELEKVILFLIVFATAMVLGILVTNRPQASLFQITKHRVTGADITTDNITRLNFIEVPYIDNPQIKEEVETFNAYMQQEWLYQWITWVQETDDELIQGVLDISRLDDTTYLLKETLATRDELYPQQTILHHQILLIDGFDLHIINSLDFARTKGVSVNQILISIQNYLDNYQQSDAYITIPSLTEENLAKQSFYVTSNTLHIILNTSTILDDGRILTAPVLHSINLDSSN